MHNRIANLLDDQTQEVNDICGAAQLRLMDLDEWQMNPESFEALATTLLGDYQNRNPFHHVDLFHKILLQEYIWALSLSYNQKQ
jgi:hypothetical protein